MAKKMSTSRGRPRLPEGTARTHVLSCKVSAVELAYCDQLAAHHGIDRADVVRQAIRVAAALPHLLGSSDSPEQTLKSFLREAAREAAREVVATLMGDFVAKDGTTQDLEEHLEQVLAVAKKVRTRGGVTPAE